MKVPPLINKYSCSCKPSIILYTFALALGLLSSKKKKKEEEEKRKSRTEFKLKRLDL